MDKITPLIDTVAALRKEFFGKDEKIYTVLGRVMANLIEARRLLEVPSAKV